MRMADVLGAATRRMQDVTDHERSVRWLRGCCLWGFGAGGTSHDGLRESWRLELDICDALSTGRRRRRRRRLGFVAAPWRLLLLWEYWCYPRYGRTARRSGVTLLSSVIFLRLHGYGRFHTLRASVLQMITLSEVENHRSSAQSSEVSVKISFCPSI